MNVFQKAPNVVVVCVTVVMVCTIAGVVILIALGRDPSQVERLVGTILSGLAAIAGAGSWLYAAAGATSSTKVEKQINGALDARMDAKITAAIGGVNGPAGNAAVGTQDGIHS